MTSRTRYTEEEDAIIAAYYPTEGTDVIHRLPTTRSRRGVEYRAYAIGSAVDCRKRWAKKEWSRSDESLMKMMFGQVGIEGMVKLLKGKFSAGAIKHKARRMDLVKNQTPPPKPQPEPDPIDQDEQDTAPMIHRHIPEGEWKRDHPIPRRSVFDVEARA